MLGREKSQLAAATGQPGRLWLHCLGCSTSHSESVSSSFSFLVTDIFCFFLFSLKTSSSQRSTTLVPNAYMV